MLFYDLKKILLNKKSMVFFSILLVIQGLVFLMWTQTSTIVALEYQDIQLRIKEMSLEEAARYLNDEMEFSDSKKGNNNFLESVQGETDDRIAYDIPTLQRLLNENHHLMEYPSYLQRVLNNGDDQPTISIFEEKNQFSKELRESIRNHYIGKDLGAGSTSFGSYGIEQMLKYPLVDVIVFLLMMFLLYSQIDKEHDIGSLTYVRTMKKGTYQTYLSKYASITIVIIAFLLASYVLLYVLSGMLYGFVDLSSTIQSVPYGVSVPSSMTIFTFLLLSFALRCLVIAGVLQILYALIFLSGKTIFGVAILGLAFLAGYGLTLLTADPNHWFHFFSLPTLLHPETSYILVRYYSFLDHAIFFAIPYMGMLILSCGLFYLGYRAYKKGFHRQRSFSWSITNRKFHSLLSYEIRKTWIKGLGILFMVLLLLLTGSKLKTIKTLSYQEDKLIAYYIDQIGNSPTKQTYELIEIEKARYFELHNAIQNTKDENEIRKYSELLEHENTFHEYCYRMDRLAYDTNREVLKEDHYRLFFKSDQLYMLFMLAYFLILILLCLTSYEKEKQSGVVLYLETTNIGKKNLFQYKVVSIGMLLMISWILCNGMIFFYQNQLYPDTSWSSAITDLLQITSFPFRIGILQYLLLQLVVQLVNTYMLTYCILYLFSKTKYGKQVAVLLSLVFIIPLLLGLTGNTQYSVFLSLFYPFVSVKGFFIAFVFEVLLFGYCRYQRKKEASYA